LTEEVEVVTGVMVWFSRLVRDREPLLDIRVVRLAAIRLQQQQQQEGGSK
jgi:hypothetical protein